MLRSMPEPRLMKVYLVFVLCKNVELNLMKIGRLILFPVVCHQKAPLTIDFII